jgi:hypothetical protein
MINRVTEVLCWCEVQYIHAIHYCERKTIIMEGAIERVISSNFLLNFRQDRKDFHCLRAKLLRTQCLKTQLRRFTILNLKKKRCNVTLKSCSTWEFRIRYSCCRPIIYFWLTIVRIIFRHNNQCLETWILIKKYGNYPNLLFLFYFCNNF